MWPSRNFLPVAMRQVLTPSPQSMSDPSSVLLIQRPLVPLHEWHMRPEPVMPSSARAIICFPLSMLLHQLLLHEHMYPSWVDVVRVSHVLAPSASASGTPQLIPHITWNEIIFMIHMDCHEASIMIIVESESSTENIYVISVKTIFWVFPNTKPVPDL